MAALVQPVGFSSLGSLLLQDLSVIQDLQAWDLTDDVLSVVFVLGQTSSIEITRCCLIVHHTEDLYVGELSSDFFHKHRQIVDLVLVDAHRGDARHVGELDVGCVVVAVQDQSAELLQLTQQSRVPIRTE